MQRPGQLGFSTFLERMPRAWGQPDSQVSLRQQPEDFVVDELMGFEFAGRGDHICLLLEKTQLNTQDVIDRLVKVLGVRAVDIGYCGLKDKIAVTRQWFSVHYAGKPALSDRLQLGEGITLLAQVRHTRKLRLGSHQGNRFRLVLRNFIGDAAKFNASFEALAERGFANYFASQRFGFGAQNINRALSLLTQGDSPDTSKTPATDKRGKSRRTSRRQRSMYLSSARSFLFNIVLAERITQDNWLRPLRDEKLILAGTQSYFDYDGSSDEDNVMQRLAAHDIHTSACLWGRGEGITDNERHYVLSHTDLTHDLALGLEAAGVDVGRRALRASVCGAGIEWLDESTVVLEFELAVGCYATSLLRELCINVS